MKPLRRIWWSLLCLVALGCSNEAGNGADSGQLLDAGGIRDALVIDGHLGPIDASDEDATAASDAAHEVDAAHLADGGEDIDASERMDAANPIDGAVRGGDGCLQALDVTAGGYFVGESTDGAADDYAPSGTTCPRGGAFSGPDRTYVVRPTVDTTYRVRVTPSADSFDPMLYAMHTCGGDCVAGTVFNGAGEPEEIEFSADAGEVIYVIVDGELGTAGAYTFEVTLL